jgi:ribosome assembly protein 4
MVETIQEPAKKRQKVDKVYDGLTNLNYNAETLADIAKPILSGTQVIIQFKDDEGQSVGVQVSVDSFSTKADLNKMLQEFLADRFDSEDDPNQIY